MGFDAGFFGYTELQALFLQTSSPTQLFRPLSWIPFSGTPWK